MVGQKLNEKCSSLALALSRWITATKIHNLQTKLQKTIRKQNLSSTKTGKKFEEKEERKK